LHAILKSGSSLYRKYLARQKQCKESTLRVMDLLDSNSAMRKLSAVQKRHLESLAVGPVSFAPGERLWQVGQPVDKAFILVEGTAAFLPKRRNTGQVRYRRTSGISTAVSKFVCVDDFSSTYNLSLTFEFFCTVFPGRFTKGRRQLYARISSIKGGGYGNGCNGCYLPVCGQG